MILKHNKHGCLLMRLQLLLITLLTVMYAKAHAQSTSYTINKIATPPKIDGHLTDSVWANATVADQFTTTLPRFGAIPVNATNVRMLAAHNGLFIAIDCTTGKIRADGSNRDETANADYFSVGFDTWDDDQNAFVFTVTAAGQLIDQRLSSGGTNTEFNAIWKAATRRSANGWTAEIWIPFKALRFPAQGEQHWGLQFTRYDRSSGQTSTWAPQDPLIRDQVLQYGQLEGLGVIEQHFRIGLTFMSDIKKTDRITTYGTKINGSQSEDKFFGAAIDGRIRFNSSTTLDLNIIPDQINDDDVYDFFTQYVQTPISRPLATEENGLFTKTGTLWRQPELNPSSLRLFYTLRPGELISSPSSLKTLNSSRFTTRTKKGIGIGVNNTLFDRPDFNIFEIFSSSSYYYRTIHYPIYPNYNHIVIEKTYRNNSWVQFSNANLYLKTGLTTNRAGIGGQWRDISNRFEIKGQYRLNTQFTSNNGAFSVADGYLSAGKINGKNTWGGSWTSPQKTTTGILMPTGSFIDLMNNHRLFAHFTQTNYAPHSTFWQNIRHSINLNSYFNVVRIVEKRMLITAQLTGLDKNFRSWTAAFGTAPVWDKEVIYFPGAELQRKLLAPLVVSMGMSTDSRKKWIVESAAQFVGNFDFTGTQKLFINASPSVLLDPKMKLSAQTYCGFTWNQNTPLTIAGTYYPIGKSSMMEFRQSVSISLFISPKWTINTSTSYYTAGETQSRAYSIQSNGQLMPLEYDVPKLNTNFQPNWLSSTDLCWYFRPGSLLKASWGYQYTRYNADIAGFFSVSKRKQIIRSLSFLYNLNN